MRIKKALGTHPTSVSDGATVRNTDVAIVGAGIVGVNAGELLAEANAIHINVPPDKLDMSQLDELGWKVYPD